MLALYLLAQAAVAAPRWAPTTVTPDASRFDLATIAPAPGCGPAGGDDIVVCARLTDQPASLAEQAEVFEPKPFAPRARMLGGTGSVHAEQRATLNGSAPALMFNFLKVF